MFEELNNRQRELVKGSLREREDMAYAKKDFDTMAEIGEMLRELDRIGKEEDRSHTEDCPNTTGVGFIQTDMPCPECGMYGWHPTRECHECGHALCWCVDS